MYQSVMRRKWWLSAALLALVVVVLAGCGGGQAATMPIGLAIKATDSSFEVPAQIDAGFVNIQLENTGQAPHHAQLIRLNDGVTVEQFQSELAAGSDAAFGMITFEGGAGTTAPGAKSLIATSQLRPGTYMVLSFIPDAEGVPDFAKGMIAPFTVAGEGGGSAPSANVTIRTADFTFDMPHEMAAGEQVWQVSNDGPQPHEVALLRLEDGKSVNDVTTFLAAPTGAPPFEDAGGLQAIQPGTTAYLHTNLEPGTYVAICFVPDAASGVDHATMGMVHEFTVK